MIEIVKMMGHPDVVWSASCQTTGSTRMHLEIGQPSSAAKRSRKKHPSPDSALFEKHPNAPVFSGPMIAPEEFEKFGIPTLKTSKLQRVSIGHFVRNRSPSASSLSRRSTPDTQRTVCNYAISSTNQQKGKDYKLNSNSFRNDHVPSFPRQSGLKRTTRGKSAHPRRAVQSPTDSSRKPSLARINSQLDAFTFPRASVNIENVDRALYGGFVREYEEDISNVNEDEVDGKQKHRFQIHQSWRKAVDTVIKNPVRRESEDRNQHIFTNTLSLPKRFTNQELAARVVTAMKSPPPKRPYYPNATLDADIGTDRRSPLQNGERAQSAPLLVRGAMRREIQQRFSSEAWYQKALATLREIPAYVSRVDEEPCNDLEEIAKRLCRTTAASRAREAATNKVVYREPESKENGLASPGPVEKPRPTSVTPAMIKSMHRFKGHKHVPGPDVEETVKRLSTYEPEKIPDRRRIVPPEDLRQVGIMNTLSWKGKDPIQRAGVDTQGLEALVSYMSGR